MQGVYLKQSNLFFLFLFDSNSTKEQKRFILRNLSKTQSQAVIEVLYNLSKNKHIQLTTSLRRFINQSQHLFSKIPTSKNYSKHLKFIQKHYRTIYIVLSKSKNIILQALKLK